MARILVVDDNQQNLELLETLLRGHHHDVVTARNGVEALERAHEHLPDMAVTDILMPEMDGFAFCRHWKSDGILKQRPLVFYTATYTDPMDEQLAFDLGADQFVCKPAKPADLIREIEVTLNRYAAGEVEPQSPKVDEAVHLREYSEALVRKLDDKVRELKQVNETLEQKVQSLHAAQVELRVRDRALAATPTGIVITDPNRSDNPIVYCNSTFETITGYRRADIVGRNCRFLQADDREQEGLEELRQAIRDQRGCQVVLRNYRSDGSMFWNRLTISPVHDDQGTVSHFVGVQQDITEAIEREAALKASEQALRQLNEELESRVLQRTSELQHANEELEAYARSVTHDLRAPARSIEGYAQALAEDCGSRLDASGRDYLQRVERAAQRMEKLIEDLLTYSRLKRHELRLRAVDLNEVVREAIDALNEEIAARGANVETARALEVVRGDRVTLIQIVTNLLSNAVKFVADGVQPVVRVRTQLRDDGVVRLWVEDNGIGIQGRDADRIFRAFERLHGIETYPGTGIGLAIVSRCCRRVGASFGVESQVGQGSRFWIDLPSEGAMT